MKQRLLKALFVCMAVAFLPQVAHAAGDVEINATNFPDENFRNYLLGLDYGEDGILTEDEIMNITKLNVNSWDIRSLQGIEYFTALTTLYCNNNQLTALNVSKNTALDYLDCYNNQIKGTSMDNLIISLPTQDRARLRVYSSVSSDEGNVCTKEQVQAAREKGWIAYYEYDYNENGRGLWKEYEGSDDTPTVINGIRTEVDKDAPVYNLRGQRLATPQKGVNIIGGRKVVVK